MVGGGEKKCGLKTNPEGAPTFTEQFAYLGRDPALLSRIEIVSANVLGVEHGSGASMDGSRRRTSP